MSTVSCPVSEISSFVFFFPPVMVREMIRDVNPGLQPTFQRSAVVLTSLLGKCLYIDGSFLHMAISI